VEAKDRRMAFYTNLKPGSYTFRVIAANADGVWNKDGDSLKIELLPHFYQTAWFYSMCGGLALAGLAGVYLWRVRLLNRKQRALQESRDFLEAEVVNRTAELVRANNSLLHEVEEHKRTEIQLIKEIEERKRTQVELEEKKVSLKNEIEARKQMEKEVERAHRQLLETSRRAGMAEIAINVLHNVGNVLNSVNVSTNLLVESVKKSKASSLVQVVALLQEHAHDLGAFITSDFRGKHVPAFLAKLSEHLLGEQEAIVGELDSLRRNVEHIKEIVAMQQNYATVGGVKEIINVASLVENSLLINESALSRHRVEVIREFENVPPITTDKHKVLQILVNVLHNAKYACDESGRADKQVTVRVAKSGEDRVKIEVADNGIGILAENLARIFQHGFSSRKGGHGFGLHSGALAAKELGGALTAHSDGPGSGATFTLELPLALTAQQSSSDRATEPPLAH
jgi:signal transduction histidine kinase